MQGDDEESFLVREAENNDLNFPGTADPEIAAGGTSNVSAAAPSRINASESSIPLFSLQDGSDESAGVRIEREFLSVRDSSNLVVLRSNSLTWGALEPCAFCQYGSDLLVADNGDSHVRILKNIPPGSSALTALFRTTAKSKVNGKVSGLLGIAALAVLFLEPTSRVQTRKQFFIATIGVHSLVVIDYQGAISRTFRFVMPSNLAPDQHRPKSYLLFPRGTTDLTLRSDDELLIVFRGTDKLLFIKLCHILGLNAVRSAVLDQRRVCATNFSLRCAAYCPTNGLLIATTTDDSEIGQNRPSAVLRILDTDYEIADTLCKFSKKTDFTGNPWQPGECCVTCSGLVFVSNDNIAGFIDVFNLTRKTNIQGPRVQTEWSFQFIQTLRFDSFSPVEFLSATSSFGRNQDSDIGGTVNTVNLISIDRQLLFKMMKLNVLNSLP